MELHGTEIRSTRISEEFKKLRNVGNEVTWISRGNKHSLGR